MLCNKCVSGDHLTRRQHDDVKRSNDSIRSSILQSLQICVPVIHLLTSSVYSLEDDEQPSQDDDGDPDDLATFNMLLASRDFSNDLEPK